MQVLHRGSYMQTDQPEETPIYGIGDITSAVVRALSSDELDELMGAVREFNGKISDAYGARDDSRALYADFVKLTMDVQARFGVPGLTAENSIAWMNVFRAQKNLELFIRKLAATDLLFEQLATIYGVISPGLKDGGLETEAGIVNQTATLANNYNYTSRPILTAMTPLFWKFRTEYRDTFAAALGRRGLKIITDIQKDGYFDALSEAISPAQATSGIEGMGIAPAIFALIKAIAICVTIIATMIVLAKVVSDVTAAGRKGMDAALELEKRKTMREQEVLAGKIPRIEADRLNLEDVAQTRAVVRDVGDAAQKGSPFGDIAMYLALGVGGIIAAILASKLL